MRTIMINQNIISFLCCCSNIFSAKMHLIKTSDLNDNFFITVDSLSLLTLAMDELLSCHLWIRY